MRFDLITIFPEFFAGLSATVSCAVRGKNGLVEVNVQDLRVFTRIATVRG